MQRTKHLLEQLLALARHEAAGGTRAPMPPVALDRAAKEVVADLLPLALDRGIDLGFGLVEPLTVRGEPVMLAALIRNLLDNALRYTPQGGRVDVGIYRENEAAILQIEDTGPRHRGDRHGAHFRAILPGQPPGRRRNRPWPVHRQAHR